MSEQTRPPTEDDHSTRIGYHDVRLRNQRVEIRDLSDGAFVMLQPHEAEQLRQWLAEVL